MFDENLETVSPLIFINVAYGTTFCNSIALELVAYKVFLSDMLAIFTELKFTIS